MDGRPRKRRDAALDHDDGLLHILLLHPLRVAADGLDADLLVLGKEDEDLVHRVVHLQQAYHTYEVKSDKQQGYTHYLLPLKIEKKKKREKGNNAIHKPIISQETTKPSIITVVKEGTLFRTIFRCVVNCCAAVQFVCIK